MKLFTDLFDAIEKSLNALKKITNLPKETRDELRTTFNDTFTLLDTSLNMVIIRLGEILRITNDSEFTVELGQLNNDAGWTKAEREFRLCKSLRHAVNETQRLKSKILNQVSVQDWQEMQNQMELILWSEDRLGNYIADKFQNFSSIVIDKTNSIQKVKGELKQLQDSLSLERRRLIQMEVDLYNKF